MSINQLIKNRKSAAWRANYVNERLERHRATRAKGVALGLPGCKPPRPLVATLTRKPHAAPTGEPASGEPPTSPK